MNYADVGTVDLHFVLLSKEICCLFRLCERKRRRSGGIEACPKLSANSLNEQWNFVKKWKLMRDSKNFRTNICFFLQSKTCEGCESLCQRHHNAIGPRGTNLLEQVPILSNSGILYLVLECYRAKMVQEPEPVGCCFWEQCV